MKDFFRKQGRLIIIALIFCFVFLAHYSNPSFSKSPTPSLIVEETSSLLFGADANQAKINSPLRLKIPAIGVDAEIEYVGLTPTGEMDVPKNTNNVAWLSYGSLPGEEGNAVIAGHLDDKNGREAVFYNLKKLNKDDTLFIEDKQGNTTTFLVKEIRIYDSEAFIPEVFISSEGQHLNLITCAGNWNGPKAEYTQRLVVFADISSSD